jgi:hypothetical protein
MYALIYDEHRLDRPLKRVISLHRTRTEAENAQEKRMKELGKRVWDCHARVVWIEKPVSVDGVVGPGDYDTWGPGEAIPEGELHPDSD